MSFTSVFRVSLAICLVAGPCNAQSDGLLERALKGKARVIDLSHKLTAGTPAYGGERDEFRYERLADYDRDGYTLGAFRVPEHFGTHVDSPAHFIKGKET